MGSTASEFMMQKQLAENSELPDISGQVFVCLMEPKHIGSVCEIEQLCFASPWNAHMFQEELEKNPLCRYFVLLDKKKSELCGGLCRLLEGAGGRPYYQCGSAAPVAA